MAPLLLSILQIKKKKKKKHKPFISIKKLEENSRIFFTRAEFFLFLQN